MLATGQAAPADRRGALRQARLRDKIRADLQEALGPDAATAANATPGHGRERGLGGPGGGFGGDGGGSPSALELAVEQIVAEGARTGHFDVDGAARRLHSQLVPAAAAAAARHKNRKITHEGVVFELCEQCQLELGLCKCDPFRLRRQVPKMLGERMLQDEYAMLALANACEAEAAEEARKEEERSRQRQYAQALSAQVETREAEQRRAEQNKRRAFAETEAQRLAFEHDKAEQRRRRAEQRQANCDELDRWCASQRRLAEEAAQRDRDEQARLQEQQRLAAEQERHEQELARQRARLEAERGVAALQVAVQNKAMAREEEKQEDLRIIEEAARLAAQRERAREAERQAVLARQEAILSSIGSSIQRVEEEKRKQFEQAMERWERERTQKEREQAALQQFMHQRAIEDLNQSLARQVREREYSRMYEHEEAAQQAILLRNKARIEETEQQAARQREKDAKVQYRTELDRQAERDRQNRSAFVGMNEAERKMNSDLLRGLGRLHDSCRECGLTQHCTCGRKPQVSATGFHAFAPPPGGRAAARPSFPHPQRNQRLPFA